MGIHYVDLTTNHHPAAPRGPRPARVAGFLVTFLAAWFALDQLVTSPPTLLSATASIAVAGGVVALGERLVFRTPAADVADRLGFRRPDPRAIAVAGAVGTLVVLTYLVGAAAMGVDLRVRPDWPVVALSALLFHGVAEELVWRGFAFAHLRRRTTFWRAVGWSIPLIALTHVPIIAGNGVVIGSLAVVSAAVTCLPFAHLWERSGRTVWGPATLHGLIGFWQLFERDYPDRYMVVVVVGSIFVPLLALLWRPERRAR